MKKIKLLYIILLATITTSCLDVDPATQYDEKDIWTSIKNVDANVMNFYQGVLRNAHVCQFQDVGTFNEGYSDLVKYTRYLTAPYNRFFAETNYMRDQTAGTFSPYNSMYEMIAKCNYLLIEIGKGTGDHLNQEELAKREGEIRFMRAFAYQELVKRHGGVILRISEEKLDGVEDQEKARSSKEECWNFIISEYKKAVDLLPESWPAKNEGRVTKTAAWGIMARAALYAEQWDQAIEASNAVISSGKHALQNNYADIFTKANNSEIILAVYYNQKNGLQHDYDINFAPSGDGNEYVGGMAAPTDEFASSFDIKVGNTWKPFSWSLVNSGDITDPWANRDPRFYQTILYNGAEWRGRTLELYVGGKDGFVTYAETGLDGSRQSATGYAFRKYLSTKEMDYNNTRSDQYWIEMRLAEIYLILSEAYAKKGNYELAYENLNIIRTRKSVEMPPLVQKSDWESYLNDLQKERICELGLEDHRFWDIRRWGIGGKVLNGQRTHGVKITKNDNGTFKYERVESDVRDRLFPDKYHVVPMPYSETTSNPLCVQDKLWR